MPLTNRVNPFGEIFATPEKGLFMGNRGRLHDETRQIHGRPWQLERWIICRLAFKGWQRTVMSPGQYTELFFLDEATALAAGHRPCAECQRDRYGAFMSAFAYGCAELAATPRAPILDKLLHEQRLTDDGGKKVWREKLGNLPDYTMVDIDNHAWMIFHGNRLGWSPAGYDASNIIEPDLDVDVLTPPGTVAGLKAGYMPVVHPSAEVVTSLR